MVTRRTAVGVGLAFASIAGAAGFSAYHPAVRRLKAAGPIDALLIDETIQAPRQMAAFIQASSRDLPVVGIRLDAAGQTGLMRVLAASHAIAGISSGATLFCLERIAWDHGFRLTRRSQRGSNDPGDDAFQQQVTALLSGSIPPHASLCAPMRAYRPSRADGTLHAWVMQKPGAIRGGQRRREV